MTQNIQSAIKNEYISETDHNVLLVLTKQGPKTRSELVKITNIARSTLYDSLLRLILKEKVIKYSEKPDGPGRPRVYFKAV